MVAEQKARFGTVSLELDQAVDHLGRSRSSVDKVTEKDQFALWLTAFQLVVADPRQQAVKQIEMAVNVADRVKAAAIRDMGDS